jgi:hypothetical protein
MNVKAIIILLFSYVCVLEAALATRNPSVAGIDPAILSGLEGKEDTLANGVIYRYHAGAVGVDKLLEHLFYMAKEGITMKVYDESNMNNLMGAVADLQAELLNAHMSQKAKWLDLKNKVKGIGSNFPLVAWINNMKFKEATAELHPLEVMILKLQYVMNYYYEPSHHEVDPSLYRRSTSRANSKERKPIDLAKHSLI